MASLEEDRAELDAEITAFHARRSARPPYRTLALVVAYVAGAFYLAFGVLRSSLSAAGSVIAVAVTLAVLALATATIGLASSLGQAIRDRVGR